MAISVSVRRSQVRGFDGKFRRVLLGWGFKNHGNTVSGGGLNFNIVARALEKQLRPYV